MYSNRRVARLGQTQGHIIAYDVGTTGIKCILCDLNLRVLGRASRSYQLSYPTTMWAEQNPDALWEAVVNTTRSVLRQTTLSASEIMSISFSCQTPCLMPVNNEGQPLRPCISWIDARAIKEADQVREHFGVEMLYEKTGVLLSSKDVICKLIWLRKVEESNFKRAHKFLDVKDYLVHQMTGVFATDWTCASLTALFDIKRREWSEELCSYVGIPIEKLATAYPSTEVVGGITEAASRETGLKSGTPVVVGAGDCFCSALGCGAVDDGSSHLYLGASSWVGTVVSQPLLDQRKRLVCSCHAVPDKWLVLGPMESTGLCLKWFRDQLGISETAVAKERSISPYKILDEEANTVERGAQGLLFFPYMLGEKSPIFDPYTKGGFFGLTLKHTRSHMVRSMLEGVAFHLRWIIESFEDVGLNIQTLRLIGGGAQSDIWPKIIADVSHKELTLMDNPIDAGALGAVLDCLVALGIQRNFTEAVDLLPKGEKVQSSKGDGFELYDNLYAIFKDHYARVKDLYKQLTESEIGIN